MRGFFSASTLESARVPLALLPKCGKCGLFKTCESPKMKPSGRGKQKVLIVGEAPGEEEDNRGVQFVGKTGTELSEVLKEVSVKMRRDAWMTNALICRPPNNRIKDERRIEYCRPNLLNTLKELKPEVIILLGAKAVKSLIGHYWKEDTGGIKRWAGFQIPCQELNAWICPTYHPSFISRENNPILDEHFKRHLDAAFKIEGRPWKKIPKYKEEVEVLFDDGEASKQIRTLASGKRSVSFDFETNMLKPDSKTREIVCCSLSDGRRTLSFPWGVQVASAMKEFVRSKAITKISHNMDFEMRWTKAVLETEVRGKFRCTMNTAHILDERKGITGLKFQAFAMLGQESYDDHIKPFLRSNEEKGGYSVNRVREVDLEELMVYCGLDSLLAWHLDKKQQRIINGLR